MLRTVAFVAPFVAVAAACTYYTSTYTFPAGQYPTIWQKPNSSVFNTAEYQQIYNSIDWTKVPNIPPKQMNASGFILNGYNVQTDPDCWWSASVCTTPKFPGLKPDIAICPEPDTWGLTYDDGPNCTDSDLYDVLKQNNQKASLFYIGSNVADWPTQAQRGFQDGHHICVHTWSHPYMTTLTNQEVVGELYYTRKAIKYVIGVTPLCWRPPFGDVDDRVRAIAAQLGMTTILWDQDTDDWQMIPAGTQPQSYVDNNYQTFINRGLNGTYATHGTIVLSHELNQGTMDEAVKWYPNITKAYKFVVPVASCMNITQPYQESNITYPTFAQYTGSTSNTSSGTGAGNATTTTAAGKSGATSNLASTLCVGILIVISALALV